MVKIKAEDRRRTNRMQEPGRLRRGGMIAAFFAAVMLFLILLQIERKMMEAYEKETVLVAICEIPAGHSLTEEDCRSMFAQREMDKALCPAAVLQNGEELAGMVPCYDIDMGSILTRGMFSGVEEITGYMAEPVVAGLRAEDLYQVAGGVIRAGDRIHIYSVNEEKRVGRAWENLWVQSVFDQSGREIHNPDQTSLAQRINVYLDKKDVSEFYTQLATGTLRVVKVCQ